MTELQINTTQNVKIAFKAAGIGERLVAFFIDFILIIIYYLVVIANFGYYEDADVWVYIAIRSLLWFPIFFYSVVQEILFEGQTLGKRLMKIKVVKIDGFQATFSDYLVRWFLRIPDIWLFGIGCFVVIFSKNLQRLGDMAAGTGVISLKDKVNINHTILEQLKTDYKPTYPNVIKLSDNDARIIKDTFTRARSAKDYATLIKLRNKLIEVVGIKEVKQSSDIEFIDVILKDYNFYTQDM